MTNIIDLPIAHIITKIKPDKFHFVGFNLNICEK